MCCQRWMHKERKKITWETERVCKSYQDRKEKDDLSFCLETLSLKWCNRLTVMWHFFYIIFFCRTEGIQPIFRLLSSTDLGTLYSLFTVFKLLWEFLSTSQESTAGR